MELQLPKQPAVLSLDLKYLWNGDVCPDERVHGLVELSTITQGICVHVEAPVLHEQIVPDAPIGSRVEGLWKFDVVDIFIVGPGHRYIELVLGAGGHFLFLSFDCIRHPADLFEDFEPVLRYQKTQQKSWVSELVLPWKFIPENLRAMNVFMLAGSQCLALNPIPGVQPDFHQPDCFPPLRLR